MTKIETQFTDHDEACKWAEDQGYLVILSSQTDGGNITLTVMK